VSSTVPLQAVGRALARLSRARGPHVFSGAGVGDSRAAILECIEAAEDVGLHANTVRGHLDALLAAGRIIRVPDQRSTPGRPHWLYSATTSASVRELSRALEEALDRADATDGARLAAATWAEGGPAVARAASLDEAVDVATEALTGYGFDAVRNPVGDQVTLRACPYLDLVGDHPVICDIHAELLDEVLSRTGQPVTLDRLDVFPRPTLCVAHLRRPDVTPERIVERAERPPRPPPPPPRRGGPAPSPPRPPDGGSEPCPRVPLTSSWCVPGGS
jgi:predicted ArsR family transcriptional regulator